ncbi:MogA/MoaB family molybdenum cofactor biosynthesis protein [Natronococcus occultus]|uniref:Molybdopterin adenylyltransferase n=1 Tax=Natronococcus occultus SP4 TaxID=694430 RepID=L0JWZ0_9EURY|nr:molybdenum cofactor synthesis domain-containing protein [Natronococcus occultus]AGB36639.1 molybdopterin adenylyltransferase [Natronococcus occultus SP4]
MEMTEPADELPRIGVVTIATDRSLSTDAAGETIEDVLEERGHEVPMREHVGSDHDKVQSIVSRMIDRDDVDLVVTSGATSIEPDDITLEAVRPLLDKELSTFDDLFATLSYEAFGSHAVAARTLAGVSGGVPVFCLPGNRDAVRLGLEKLLLPEAGHLVSLARSEATVADPGIEKEIQEE